MLVNNIKKFVMYIEKQDIEYYLIQIMLAIFQFALIMMLIKKWIKKD